MNDPMIIQPGDYWKQMKSWGEEYRELKLAELMQTIENIQKELDEIERILNIKRGKSEENKMTETWPVWWLRLKVWECLVLIRMWLEVNW